MDRKWSRCIRHASMPWWSLFGPSSTWLSLNANGHKRELEEESLVRWYCQGGEILAFVYRKWGNLMRYTTQIGLFLNISDIQWESGCDKEMTRAIKKWWTIRHLHNTFRQNFPFNNVVCLSNADLTFLTKWCRGPLDMIGEKKTRQSRVT